MRLFSLHFKATVKEGNKGPLQARGGGAEAQRDLQFALLGLVLQSFCPLFCCEAGQPE